MTCPYCTGGTWLNDTPDLGLCVCVTADRVAAALGAERQLSDATDENADLTEQVVHRDERLAEAWDKLRENPDVNGPEKQSLAEACDQALDLAYGQDRENYVLAADALQRYLVGLGHGANPVRLDDPDLDALADLLLP